MLDILDANKKKKTINKYNLLHFHGGSTVVNVMFDGGQLTQSANNSVLVNAMGFIRIRYS